MLRRLICKPPTSPSSSLPSHLWALRCVRHAEDHAPCRRSSGTHLKDIERVILQETKISRDHLTPEIALHLITPECRLFHEPVPNVNVTNLFKEDPFWAFYWPGGQAISRYVLDNPSLVAGKSVLDVGSGCGASAVAALTHKAKYVVANDIDEAAGCAVLLNAQLNGVDIERLHICTKNLIIASQLPWLQSLRKAGKQILVGDPGRHGLTADRRRHMRLLAKYELTESGCIENNGFRFVNVWEWR
ncbi:electron transfer flavoprotein beta subunit lysine methyltransferase isoform X2 [Bactrocera oleae]|uniref:electron transfer flavoprotein beta subunit lysine methyltransferase isoform X2 n=1 Tax=Bactrocera oleae TaxID=104688 RepID=UPI00387EB8B2